MEQSSNNKDTTELITSAFFRFLKVGSLFGKVGFSLFGNKLLGLFLNKDAKEKRIIENFVKNGDRIFEVLGQLKGGVMKIGQMVSLQEGLLPPEILQFLRMLQKEAPPMAYSVMIKQLEKEIPHYSKIFLSIEEKPIAAASIGQVYRAILHDKTVVALKIQYPDVADAIRADLKNLKILFKLLFSLFSKADFDAVWQEIQERMLEELDYKIEAKNQIQFKKDFQHFEKLIIPKVYEEYCTEKILVTEFVTSESLDHAKNYNEETRNELGISLIEIFLFQLVVTKNLHADPNAGNYGFRQDGHVVLFDFGCIKNISPEISTIYQKIIKYLHQARWQDVPDLLHQAGLKLIDNKPIPDAILKTYFTLFGKIFGNEEYHFGSDKELFDKLRFSIKEHYSDAADIQIPPEIVFLHRAFEGLFGNLNRLGSKGKIGLLMMKSLSV